MFINKFNNLIRNKWVWGIFAVFVCLAFVGTDLFSSRGRGGDGSSMGTLDGKPVTYQEYNQARTVADFEIRMQRSAQSEVDSAAVEKLAWQYLAALRTAEKLGFSVSNEEVLAAIASDPAFQNEATGKFDAARYGYILSNFFQLTESGYQQLLATRMLIAKTVAAFSSASWSSPSLIEQQSRDLSDSYTFRMFTLSNEFENAELEITDAQLEEFYNANKTVYTLPNRRSVRYVLFHANNFSKDASIEISDEDARYYYDEHLADFATEIEGVKTNLTFEEARTIIDTKLRQEKAAELAEDAAADFADIFYSAAPEQLADSSFFEATAAARGSTVVTSELFAADARFVHGIAADAVEEFVERAFALSPDSPRDQYSDAVSGKDAFYVLAFGSDDSSHEPGLDAVRNQVKAAVLANGKNKLFTDKAADVIEKFTAASREGKADDALAAEFSLVMSTNVTATVLEADSLKILPRGFDWAGVLSRLGNDELSPLKFVPSAAVFFRLVDRQSGDVNKLANLKDYVAAREMRMIADTVHDEWLVSNLAAMKPSSPLLDDLNAEENEAEETSSED